MKRCIALAYVLVVGHAAVAVWATLEMRRDAESFVAAAEEPVQARGLSAGWDIAEDGFQEAIAKVEREVAATPEAASQDELSPEEADRLLRDTQAAVEKSLAEPLELSRQSSYTIHRLTVPLLLSLSCLALAMGVGAWSLLRRTPKAPHRQ